MSSLRALFRWMLAGWLVLVLLLSVVVARGSHTRGPGNLLAFLFFRGEYSEPLPPPLPPGTPPPAPKPVAAPAPPPPPVIVAVPEPAPAPPEDPDWIPLEEGRAEGTGRLGRPEITALEDGTVEVLFPCPGEPGDYRLYRPTNVVGLSVDLLGPWGRGMLVNRTLAEGAARKVQIASHAEHGIRWLRVSAISRSGRLAARVEHSPARKQLRVRFAPEG